MFAIQPPGLANPMSALGDLIEGGLGGAPTRLSEGALGTVLTVLPGPALGWGPPGGVSFPLSWPSDMGFQPDAIANSALSLRNLGSANGLLISGTASTVAPSLAATGSDTNIGLNLVTKGSGPLQINGVAGSAGQVLTSHGAGAAPTWTTPALNPLTSAGDLIYSSAGSTAARLGIGAAAQVLTVVAGLPAWQNASSGFLNPMTAAGDLIVGGAGGAAARLGAGADGQVLRLSAGLPAWAAAASPGFPLTWPTDMGFQPGGVGSDALRLSQPALAVNGLAVTGSVSGAAVSLAARGADSDIGLRLASLGAGTLQLLAGSATGSVLLGGTGTPSSVPGQAALTVTGADTSGTGTGNGISISQAAAGGVPELAASGADADLSLRLRPQGAGALILAGHWSSAGAGLPTVATAAEAQAASLDTGSTDVAGSVQVTSVASPSVGGGELLTVSFATPYPSPPNLILLGVAQTSALAVQVSSKTASGFTVRATSQPLGATTYAIAYLVVGA